MSTLSQEEVAKIIKRLEKTYLPKGLGSKMNACSIASINLALSGHLTDKIPDCMSDVIGRWIVATQDRMPDAMRNSKEWKALLPWAAGTGKELEKERRDLILNWIWDVILPRFQIKACKLGLGPEWAAMLKHRDIRSAIKAQQAANDKFAPLSRNESDVCAQLHSVAYGVERLIERTSRPDGDSSYITTLAIDAMVRAVGNFSSGDWAEINPIGLLEKMIDLGEPKKATT